MCSDTVSAKTTIKDSEESYNVNRKLAIKVSRYIERAVTGPWTNSATGVVELEESDHASLYNVDMFIRYIEYFESGPDGEDSLHELEDFGALANLWLFADFLQSRRITKAIMEESELKAEDMELLDAEMFNTWWTVLENQPPFEPPGPAVCQSGQRATGLPNFFECGAVRSREL